MHLIENVMQMHILYCDTKFAVCDYTIMMKIMLVKFSESYPLINCEISICYLNEMIYFQTVYQIIEIFTLNLRMWGWAFLNPNLSLFLIGKIYSRLPVLWVCVTDYWKQPKSYMLICICFLFCMIIVLLSIYVFILV